MLDVYKRQLLESPLMIGCDIREMSEGAKAILTNKELIAIQQDPRCNRPYIISGDSRRHQAAKCSLYSSSVQPFSPT